MCQARGYEACTPLDISGGWNVFNPQHRRQALELIDRENPYLVTIAYPCGPWSPWQHMSPDQDKVWEKRLQWIPILKWIRNVVQHQQRKGGKVLLENPKTSAAWDTQELRSLEVTNPGIDEYELVHVDMCAFGLKDCDNGLPHRKSTYLGTDSPGIKRTVRGKRCNGLHEHQPLEGSNSRGSRTRQAARWTSKLCRAIIEGIQLDLESATSVAFAAESREEDLEEEPHPLDEVYDEKDLESARPTPPQVEMDLVREEMLEAIPRMDDPHNERVRRENWLKIDKKERVGIRRLHVMTSHATKPQMQRMLRYSNAPPAVVKAVKYFKCAACERLAMERHPAVNKVASPYVFGEEVGLDVFEVKDASGDRYHVLHAVCSGTTFQTGEILGLAAGVPSSKHCLEAFLRFWMSWAGAPKRLMVDRGTHNRGVFQMELEKMGVDVRSIATEAPHQIGRTERHGGLLKSIIHKVVNAVQAVGALEMQLVLVQALEVKNRLGNLGGFSPAQWVLGRNPRIGGWTDEDEDEAVIQDEDPLSTFNRRGAIREAARAAWATEDSQKRVRKALLRKGGSETQRFVQGDLVAFMRKKGGAPRWYGPARVLTQEGKNVWILHGGVPILTAENMVRPASSEESLEKEQLGSMKGKKRGRGLLYEDTQEPPQIGLGPQPAYLDFRGDEAEGEKTKPNIPPTEYGGGDPEDDSPKRMRQVIQEQEDAEAGQQPSLPQPRPEDVPVEVNSDEDLDTEVQKILDEPASLTPLAKAMAISGGNQLDVGERRSRSMKTPEEKEESVAERMLRTQRSRSPPETLKKEFTCFLAKRYNKKKQDPEVTGELKYERETEEMQKKIDAARGKEWGNWIKYKATRTPTPEEVEDLLRSGVKAIPMRWVDIDKNAKLRTADNEVPEKLKSRLVLRGDLEPGDFRVDCPTATLVGTHLVMSFAACGGYTLRAGDITAAFLQGKPIQRPLLMKVPHTGIPTEDGSGYALEPGNYIMALTHIYGSRDAPRGFWLELRQAMLNEGLREIEPALYALSSAEGELQGLVVTHVDDILWCGKTPMEEVMERIQKRFTFGSVEQDDFRFCGRKVTTKDNYLEISAPEILSKVKPIRVEGERNRSPTDDASAEEQSQMRAVLGSIGYVARLCRPELSYRCSCLQGKQSKPKQMDLIATNKFLAAAQKTSENGIKFMKNTFNFDDAVLLSITDASHAAEIKYSEKGRASGHRSQAGRFLLLADKMPQIGETANVHILDWSSHTIKRVCRSTLQAEVLSSMDGCEMGGYVRMMIYSMYYPKERTKQYEIAAKDSKILHWISDCRSYIDTMSNAGQGVVSDKRLAVDLTALRQDLWRAPGTEFGEPSIQDEIPEDCTDRLWWICTKDMLADGLTKAMVWNDITNLTNNGQFKLREAAVRAFTDIKGQ